MNFSNIVKFTNIFCLSFERASQLDSIKKLFTKVIGRNVQKARYLISLVEITPEKEKKANIMEIDIAIVFARFLSLKFVDTFNNKEKQKIGYRIDLTIFRNSL